MFKPISDRSIQSHRNRMLAPGASIEVLERRTLMSATFGSPAEFSAQGGRGETAPAIFHGDQKLAEKLYTPSTAAPHAYSAKPIVATAGELASPIFGSFDDPGSVTSAFQLTAYINWGDGQTSMGVMEIPAPGQYSFFGTHTYAKPGTHKVSVDVMQDVTHVATITSRAVVTQNSAAGRTVHAVAGQTFNGPVALYDTRIESPSTPRFTASIDWGDNSIATDGTLTRKHGHWQLVTGSHTYAKAGAYRIAVSFYNAPPPAPDGTATGYDIALLDEVFSTAVVR